ncbi:MAG TPA: tripartite tricarboxylate transporter substrate binding protein [Burkholderiaceae bacterium]|nr:tripartite tricarboxylate transporter substrate binding protein [Burkholderiaceae bacterium]
MKHRPSLAALFALALAWCGCVQAQESAGGPFTLVSSFPAGSGNDLVARAVAPALGEILGQPMIVDNRPGAGGAIGAQYVARARPDGRTLFLASLSFSVLPSLMSLSFDPARDFEAVMLLGEQSMAFVVPAELPVGSMKDLVALAKARPGQLNYASAGIGSIGHLTGELLKSEQGLNIVHVPFKGTPEALQSVITGEVQMSLVAMPAAEPQIKAGKVKALGVTGRKRYEGLPDVPTMAEAGFPSMGDSVWYAVLVPAGTPKEIVARLNAALRQAVGDPVTAERLRRSAKAEPAVSTPPEAQAYVRAQIAKWGVVAAQAGLKPQAAR